VLEAFSTTERWFQNQPPGQPWPPVFVFDRVDIQKITTRGSYGWVDLRITGPASIAGSTADLKQQSAQQRWTLNRGESDTWELAIPTDIIYLSRAAASAVLVHQLAALTDTGPEQLSDHSRKLQLARLLYVLLDAPPR